MSQRSLPPEDLENAVEKAAQHPWFEGLARLGFAAKGTVYFVIGLLAGQAAIGTGSQPTDTEGALIQIVAQPFGRFLLGLIAIGIVGYVLWRVVQTVLDPQCSGNKLSLKRIVHRLGYALSAIAYTGVAFTAVRLIVDTQSVENDDTLQDWTAHFLDEPLGRWAVLLGGAAVIGVGISYLHEAFTVRFYRKLNLHHMSRFEQILAIRVGQFGIAARGVVFGVIGIFLVLSAIQLDAQQARGVGESLAALARLQPFGSWLLGSVALGLIAYSLYSLILARYHKLVD